VQQTLKPGFHSNARNAHNARKVLHKKYASKIKSAQKRRNARNARKYASKKQKYASALQVTQLMQAPASGHCVRFFTQRTKALAADRSSQSWLPAQARTQALALRA